MSSTEEAAAHVTGLEDEFEMALGRLLFHARRGHRAEFIAHLARTRVLLLMPSLAAASMEAYSRAYPILVRLHILHELEQAMSSTGGGGSGAPAFPVSNACLRTNYICADMLSCGYRCAQKCLLCVYTYI